MYFYQWCKSSVIWGIKSINEETHNLLAQSELKLVKKVQDLDKNINNDCWILEALDWGVSCRSPWQDYLFLANGYPADALKKMYLSTEFFNKNILRVIEKERFEKQDWLEAVADLDRGVGSADNDKNFFNKMLDNFTNLIGTSKANGNIVTTAMMSSQDPLSELQDLGHRLITGVMV